MAKCPKCNKEIEYLEFYADQKCIFSLDYQGKPDYEEVPDFSTDVHYDCPECLEEVATEESDAIDILNGDEEAKEEHTEQSIL
jgi:hypothetical protein